MTMPDLPPTQPAPLPVYPPGFAPVAELEVEVELQEVEPLPLRERLLRSAIRTVVPAIVGLVTAAAARHGFDLPAGILDEVIAGGVTGAYYLAVRWAEERWPRLGILLGRRGAPFYGWRDVEPEELSGPAATL